MNNPPYIVGPADVPGGGFLGHLSEPQRGALNTLRERLARHDSRGGANGEETPLEARVPIRHDHSPAPALARVSRADWGARCR